MSDDRTIDEAPRPMTGTAEPVPEADALEQAQEVAPGDEQDVAVAEDAEVPEGDAIEQSRIVELDDDEHP
jgi:hypothetical protein